MSDNIPKQIVDRLEKYGPKLGKSTEDLIEEFNLFLEVAEEQYPTVKDKNKKALDLLVNSYRRKHGDFRRSSAQMYEGWIDGATPLRDNVQEKLRRIQYRLRTEGRQSLMFEGLIDENGTPIDDRPNIFGRRDNPNFGKPLAHADPAYIRTIYGMYRLKGETGVFKPFQMTFFEDAAYKLRIKTGKSCEFRAGTGKKEGQLYGNENTKFFPIQTDWDLEDEYEKSNSIIPCSELETRMNSSDWDERDVRVKVDIININPNPLNDRGDRVMGVADLSLDIEETIPCFVPAHVKMDFGEDTKVIMTGRARQYKQKPALSVYGIWAIPGQIGYGDLDLITDEEEIIEDVGWVDEDFDIDFESDKE